MHFDTKTQLNPEQLRAVSTVEGPLLIIAGAGSGKTRVITYRIAHMLSQGISQSSILALTFTNKAAREMAARVRDIAKRRLSNLTVSTFHAFGVQVLRRSIPRLGFRENFSIYDQVDKIALIKESAREIKMSHEGLDFSYLANLFSAVKTERKSWDNTTTAFKPLYQEYLDHLRAYNAVDFDDLIMLPIRLFGEFPDELEEYRRRYRYIMVDEFQDTSIAQYRLMKLLGEESRNVCVVGDDDQSIYSWRGANYENLLLFERDFPEREEIKLEQNYRSTKTILTAANGVIANNRNRKVKELWTGTVEGTPIELFYPEDETKEGAFIADAVRSMVLRDRLRYHDIGILVRTNSLTGPIEAALLSENIPYRVSGGMSFFQRKEIKDLISYLRVMANPDDDVSLLRIVNTPRRGIGKRTLEQIVATAATRNTSLYSAISALRFAADSPLAEKSRQDLSDFVNLIDYYRERILSGKDMADTTSALVDALDYWGYLLAEHPTNDKVARYKFKNISLFIRIFEEWEKDPDTIDPTIYDYLNRISLITRDDVTEDDERGKVNLMTIHSAKGLEFEVVFLAGAEERIIPHERAIAEDPENVEEERRLFYVAITRAKQKLYMTACRKRKYMRETIEPLPSPFITEIPEQLIAYHEDEEPVTQAEAANLFRDLKQRLSD